MSGRKLNLEPRKIATRESSVEIFDIQEIEKHFHDNLDNIKQKFDLFSSLKKSNKLSEAEDILRFQIVFLDSALDFFMHEIIKLGVLDIYHGSWHGKKTEKYLNLTFQMREIESALNNWSKNNDPDDDLWLKNWVNKKFNNKTMMDFDSIKDCCNLLDIDYKKIAETIFYNKSSSTKPHDQLKECLNKLYHRRNRIVHQSDRNRKNAQFQPIQKDEVENFINEIEQIVSEIIKKFKLKESI